MHAYFDEILGLMECTFRDLENSILNKPKIVNLSSGKALRYVEKNIHQAIIQKMAHVQSVVRAARVLFDNGFAQEKRILHRVIDETIQDILFLVLAVTQDNLSDLHKRFLDAFWEEEIDESGDLIESEQKRPMIPRKKIMNYLVRDDDAGLGESTVANAMQTLHKVNSGFVHGASPQIMESYCGNPPRFHIDGMLGTPRMKDEKIQLWVCLYTSFLTYISCAKAFNLEKNVSMLNTEKLIFDEYLTKLFESVV